MTFLDQTPEDKLASAQASYDKAIREKANADLAVNEKYRVVVAARDYLEQAKREAAAAIPVGPEIKISGESLTDPATG